MQKNAIGLMFDRIAPTYDRVNRVLSFGQDVRWRNRVVDILMEKKPTYVLDIATGTGDLLIALAKKSTSIRGLGVDVSKNMLALAQKKLDEERLLNRINTAYSAAEHLLCEDESFDAVTISFGIRNVEDISASLYECRRVLKNSGHLVILEFSLPSFSLFRFCYLTYFRYVLPFIGGLLSNDGSAYRYLNRSVEAFPSVLDFSSVLKKHGFTMNEIISLSFGIATIYVGRKI